MDLTLLAVGLAYFLLSHLVAKYIGTKRAMGYGRSVFYSVLFTPVFGLIMTYFSPRA